jgi:DNA-directed RNA polymerase sigma subunit (sigma70/sigma32)
MNTLNIEKYLDKEIEKINNDGVESYKINILDYSRNLLNERDKKIFDNIFINGLNYSETARNNNLSRERIRQIINKILKYLRYHFSIINNYDNKLLYIYIPRKRVLKKEKCIMNPFTYNVYI